MATPATTAAAANMSFFICVFLFGLTVDTAVRSSSCRAAVRTGLDQLRSTRDLLLPQVSQIV